MANVPSKTDVSELRSLAGGFGKRLRALKHSAPLRGIDWYPYDTLSCWDWLDKLLTGTNRRLLALARGGAIADFGCADGDLSFFLESLGYSVEAWDNPAVNHNRLAGFENLKAALQSRVGVRPMDLDSPFELGQADYGLCFFLGILYHLRNPMYALEQLARHCRYCVLSTRIASVSPDRKTDLSRLPVAYLVDEREANDDSTNYWIFSEAGLRRVLKRTGWSICEYLYAGSTQPPDPVSRDADGRAFCLLRSFLAVPAGVRLLHGWHAAEPGNWRWTERCFGLMVDAHPGCTQLELRFTIPLAVIARLPAVTLRASVNGVDLGGQTCTSAGDHVYSQALPAGLGGEEPVRVDFELDRALPPGDFDERELGIIVRFGAEEPGLPDSPVSLF